METVQSIEIPPPVPDDSETVVTALETAAVFAAKGDASEALRWLKRAVDGSSESGDDARVLLLARTAVELNLLVKAATHSVAPATASSVAPANGTNGISQRPLPKPTSKGNLAAGERASELPARAEATPLPPSRPPLQASSNVAQISAPSGRPPPPSARRSSFPSPALASNAPTPVPSAATPSVPAARTSSAPLALAPSSPAPRSAPRASSAPQRLGSSPPNDARGARSHSSPISRPSRPVIPGGRSSISRQLAAARLQSLPDESEITARGGPGPEASAAISAALAALVPAQEARPGQAALGPSQRQAARVSVEQSSAEPGVYLVRVLEDGKAPPEGGAEAYLVVVDPNAPPLRAPG